MTMPRTFTLIRHGESESNAAKSAASKGKPLPQEADLMRVHTSERRLTPRGIAQARLAGIWVREDIESNARRRGEEPYANTRLFVSPFVRAIETAGHMDIPASAEWRIDARLCERNWGALDHLVHSERIRRFGEMLKFRKEHALFWTPHGGESLQTVMIRAWLHFDMLHRQCAANDVYAVSHGEMMWGFRFLLEYWMPKDLASRMIWSRSNGKDRIINCRIIQYTRELEDGTLANRLVRVRFVNPERPTDPDTNSDWEPIRQRTFTSKELIAYAASFPQFLRESA